MTLNNKIFSTKKRNLESIALFFALFIASLFQVFGHSVDYSTYLDFLKGVSIQNPPIEPFAFFLRDLSRGHHLVFFGAFAFVGITTKLIAISSLSKYYYLSLIAYLSSYFFLHDYTQIRAGVASGFFLISLNDLNTRNFKPYMIKTFIAISFHISAIVMLPLYIVCRFRLSLFKILPVLGFLIAILNIDLQNFVLKILSVNNFFFELYTQKKGHSGVINVFNLISISYLLLFYLLTIIVLRLDKTDFLLYKIFSVSLFIFFGLSVLQMPVITFRIYEYLNIVLIILLANLPAYFKQRNLIMIAVVIYFVLFLYHLIFNVHIIS